MTAIAKAGRYEVLGELGRGAMGVVYKAADPVIGRTVAVKTIKLSEEGTGLSRPELLGRFQTEARAAGLLTHPNIVVVYDAGEEDGLYYITMELVEGKSLQAVLDSQQKFALPRTLRIMEQACNALHFAHERSIVHRDVKPANIMLTADDTVKITDFGTAKILQFGTVQQTTHVMGTPSYMSPEQVKGRPVDGRSDIFSLGVMLYELVTGEKPFPGQNITTVIYKIVNEDPVPPRQIDPSIHPGISAVILKALAKDPAQRYQSCREMQEDLKNYRALGDSGNPNSTMTLMGGGLPHATVAASAGWTSREHDVTAAANSLAARAAGPGQTPTLRRTGAIPVPVQAPAPPQSKSALASAVVAAVLIGVIVYGFYKVRPAFQASQQGKSVQTLPAAAVAVEPAHPTSTADLPVTDSHTAATQASAPKPAEVAAQPETPPAAAESKPEPIATNASVEAGEAKPAEPLVSAAAADYKARVEAAARARGFGDRVHVEVSGNSLTVSGKLRPAEHSEMLQFLEKKPASVHVVDHFEDDRASVTEAKPAAAVNSAALSPGRGGIRVQADTAGAAALLYGANGKVQDRCSTPCSFLNLQPAQYSIEVRKDGYQPVQTALQVRAGKFAEQAVKLESLKNGLYLATRPAGATVWINGSLQPGQTPVTLPLGPGQYNLVMRLEGYEAYTGQVAVKDNAQTTLDVELPSRENNVAWADIKSEPDGAEILIDGAATGRTTPARLQIQSGSRTITLRHPGFQPIKRVVAVSEGSSVSINEKMKAR